MKSTIRIVLIGFCVFLMAFPLVAQQMPQTRKERIEGTATVKTEELSGTVIAAESGTLVVRMSDGSIRSFTPPESRRFVIDGKEMTVNELRPGTKLRATLTTTTTPVTERTTTVGTGKVWFVQGNTVILTLPNNENRQYKVAESYRFNVNGKPASVHDLKKGMTVSAQKIVEEPKTEIASNTRVVGSAPPPPKPVAAETASKMETPAPAPPPPPKRVEAAPAPAPVAEAAPPPRKLPTTGSLLPLAGLIGLLCTGASFGLRAVRRFQ